ncbi:hypothetical protein [Bacillus subtilis]|uniref:hypothetical protein n=1 Tax=Bacillus subtilis TaxID=1423 RepID=UPI00100A15C3|nr:hypothetical protein [Bacillus subtilis]MEC0365131.1 hypothetical protein [Bacillus subtilis]MEC0402438.1 hypothetical protein [Bacillus subtilis]MEC0429948.1 hypothetical protein [Bacillus subtilis]QAW05694.1 hypothetical protein ES968_17705 [Bacillus subtilis]WRK88454.1 hypothetical protein U7118_04035 [Bacillus subtilis]
MKITVDKKVKKFYLALSNTRKPEDGKWKPAVGHEIQVGKYRFCAIPSFDHINVSEVTTGLQVLKIPMTSKIYQMTLDKEDTLKFFESVGKDLIKIINKHSAAVFDKCLMEQKKHMFSRLGEMPQVEVYDMEEDAK